MLYTHFTQEVLGLQDVIITKVESNEKELIIYTVILYVRETEVKIKGKERNFHVCAKKNEFFYPISVAVRYLWSVD